MADNMNNKNYRDIVLTYVDKLGQIDKLEDQLAISGERTDELKKEINELKKEASKLKTEIDNHRGKK